MSDVLGESAAVTVWVCEGTLKNDDEPLLGVAVSVVPTDGRLGKSLVSVEPSRSLSLSLPFSRNLPNDILDALLTSDRAAPCAPSFEPVEGRF